MTVSTEITKKEETLPGLTRNIPVVAPVVDIYENDDEILLHADMPGVTKNDIEIKVDNGNLEISGVRTLKTSGAVNWVEFGEIDYRRTFSVPQTIDIEKVNAELKDGVLRLHLPKSESAKPRQIEIH